jgi:hypothetical protein
MARTGRGAPQLGAPLGASPIGLGTAEALSVGARIAELWFFGSLVLLEHRWDNVFLVMFFWVLARFGQESGLARLARQVTCPGPW